MACPIRLLSVERQGDVPLSVQGGSGGIPRPFEGGIGGPGGHRGEVGIPPAPLAGGAIPQKKSHVTKAKTSFPRRGAHASENLSFKSYIQRELSNKFAMRKGRHEQRGGPLAHELPGFTPGAFYFNGKITNGSGSDPPFSTPPGAQSPARTRPALLPQPPATWSAPWAGCTPWRAWHPQSRH